MALTVDDQLIWYILDETSQCLGHYRNILAVLGAMFVLKKVSAFAFDILKTFETYFLSRFLVRRNLRKICGNETWAVITGASDGIGKAFAIELARHKYNIVLLSRSLSKLQNVSEEIENKYGVQTRVICVDFSQSDIYEQIKRQLEGLEVGLLVNNVGTHYGVPAYFLDLSEKKLRDLVSINISSLTMMTHLVLPGMVNRKRGAIINISSSAAQLPTPLVTVYSATKAYVAYFSQGLSTEYAKDNIVVQCLKPYYISTAMTFHCSPNIFIPTAKSYVQSALATLPYSSRTCGYWSHGLLAWLFSFSPEFLWLRCAYYWHRYLIYHYREKHSE